MARFSYRIGTGSEIITPDSSPKRDEAPARRATRIHLPWADDPSSSWRVVARLDSGDVLLCLGATRQEASKQSKARVGAGEVPEGTFRLALERWKGGKLTGHWEEVRPEKGELPRLPREPRRSRLVRRA